MIVTIETIFVNLLEANMLIHMKVILIAIIRKRN